MAAMQNFLQSTGFYLFSQGENWKCLLMIFIACVLLYLGIKKKFEPLLLVPIAFGMLLTNLPGAEMFHEILFAGGHIHWDLFGGGSVTGELLADLLDQGVSQDILAPYAEQLMTAARDTFSPEVMESAIAEIASAANGTLSDFAVELQALVQAEQAAAYYGVALPAVTVSTGLVDVLYLGVKLGIYPCLIFLGVGAMTDFGPLIANPKSLLLGAAAQLGIFITFVGCRLMGFTGPEASSIGIIGGADGPTAIFVTAMLAPALLGPIAVSAYSYMALVPVIQPPIMKALTTQKEREIVMRPLREVSKREKILFPIVVTIFLGVSVGATATGTTFLSWGTLKILAMGIVAFSFGTAGGVLLAKFMNLFLKEKINPLIGSAGVSAVPMAARVSQKVGQEANPGNFLLMHAMGPNVAGVIGSAIAAGVLISLYG